MKETLFNKGVRIEKNIKVDHGAATTKVYIPLSNGEFFLIKISLVTEKTISIFNLKSEDMPPNWAEMSGDEITLERMKGFLDFLSEIDKRHDET